MKKKIIIFFILIISDLLSKFFIYNYVGLYKFIKITNFLDITHIHNYGVSFGLLSNVLSPLLLIIVGFIVVFFIIYLFIISKEKIEQWGLFIVISGAMGNIIDRIINGYVIDFIYFHINQYYWPAFNFADIYISIGIIMILFNIIKKNLIKKND